MSDDNLKIDDLVYDFPPNIMGYTQKSFFGLSINQLIILALPALFLSFIHIALGVIGAIVGVLLMRKFDAIGARTVPEFVFARIKHIQIQKQEIVIPKFFPGVGANQVKLLDADGNEVVSLGNN
ncbi:MAG: hypothetical protein AB9888_00180 [Bacteroidales bacterium]